MQVNPALFTVAQLREQVKVLDPSRPTSKLRKPELVALLEQLTDAPKLIEFTPQEPADMTGHWAEQGFDVDPDESELAERLDTMIGEDTLPDRTLNTLRVLSENVADVATALRTMGKTADDAARQLGRVAWASTVATVRSMGHQVRGKVVDTVLREPGANGMGRVCLVIEHQEQANDRGRYRVWEPVVLPHPRRTLHALVDVQFTPLAS